MIAMTSHQDLFCLGANVDRAAFTDPEFFAQCIVVDGGFDHEPSPAARTGWLIEAITQAA